jgi:hypothetical protein
MTREATNTTTATNYALEGEIRDRPAVPAIAGQAGEHGPWLELIPLRDTTVPTSLILTKTHCEGFCSGMHCGPGKTIQTTRSFLIGCLTGTKAFWDKRHGGALRTKLVAYDKSLVKKAIHIFRHPLDNIVARFHLELNARKARGDVAYIKKFPKDANGFRRWCRGDDSNRRLLESQFVDSGLREKMVRIPCFNEFYRYVQWHNLAFETTRTLGIPTLLLHYHEYSSNFTTTRDRILAFLELPRIGDGITFQSGKEYRSYYSSHDKKAIRSFLVEFASPETWRQLEDYDFA